VYGLVAVLRGGQGHGQSPVRAPPAAPPTKLVARLHNSCIHSVASHSWCQITLFIQSYIMSSGLLGSKYRCGHSAGHPKLLQLETPLVRIRRNGSHCGNSISFHNQLQVASCNHAVFSADVCFYRAMRFSAKRGIAIACRLSVRPSVCLSATLVDCDHIGWNSSKNNSTIS